MLNAVIKSMRCAPIFLLAVLASWPLALQAAPLTELSQTELRETVNSGRSVSVKDALKAVRQLVPGDPVDVRAFDGNGVFYRVLVMQASGVVRAIVIDASTGKVLPPSSPTAREVNAKASSKAGASAVSTNKTKKAANAPSNGKSAGKGNSGNGGGGSGEATPAAMVAATLAAMVAATPAAMVAATRVAMAGATRVAMAGATARVVETPGTDV